MTMTNEERRMRREKQDAEAIALKKEQIRQEIARDSLCTVYEEFAKLEKLLRENGERVYLALQDPDNGGIIGSDRHWWFDWSDASEACEKIQAEVARIEAEMAGEG